jgi:hypothetical protein
LELKGERIVGQNNEKTEKVKLTWQTTQETNNKGFEVEMSENGLTYQKIAFVDTKGDNQTQTNNYQIIINNSDDGYYRLKQVDLFGDFSYSSVVFVEGIEVLNVYPNPNKGTFMVETGRRPISARLLDVYGRQVWAGEIKNSKIATNVPEGIYFLHTTRADKVKIFKIVIGK